MKVAAHELEDGRVLCVMIEIGMWHVWIDGEDQSHIIGWPLEDTLMDVLGWNSAHDEMPDAVGGLARRIRREFPRKEWPDESPR